MHMNWLNVEFHLFGILLTYVFENALQIYSTLVLCKIKFECDLGMKLRDQKLNVVGQISFVKNQNILT
jgi:hypothetical protein